MTAVEGQIQAKREAAATARRLSVQVTSQGDRDRLIEFAAELDAQADALELGQSTPPTAPAVTQMQMQVQQGPPAADEEEPKA